MKPVILGMLAVAAMSLGTQVFADDSVTQATPTKKQMMRDCIRKHEAQDVTQSKSDLTRICKDELKQQQVTGAMPAAPPTDAPRDTASNLSGPVAPKLGHELKSSGHAGYRLPPRSTPSC